ncbi:histidine kinase dimerization/phosphoacceptor domain -containing protein [Methylobacterium sp. 17Sr1-1]|uniref:histidine kinase dimerization/phosphoacceptor domain -containing protein n=1 Tax=Methylobacterium sp. 17Sr1-1 TaxID=2202826 RepID=UPI000D6F2EA8|nr:histidine kinase dimerization/phosphoacceptor domain -containing protein [Methylobacterium sp. 17Sr1-1]AWN53365.1 histidine kinase [Methylobacterium sp. 17Sr1-1]
MASDGSIREAHEAGNGRAELPYRLRQQALMGAFARMALQTRDLDALLGRASELCAEALGAACCQVLEYRASDHAFVIRACTGLGDDRVGTDFAAGDEATPAAYAFRTGAGVLANGIRPGAEHNGARFHVPEGLMPKALHRSEGPAPAGPCHAVNVPIALGDESRRAYGVLEAWGTEGHGFDRADQEFLAGFAGLIGIAVERHQGDARLRDALDHQVQLTREMSHRVKNSLGVVAGLLRLQARDAQSEEVRHALEDAGARIATVAEVHDHLWRGIHQLGMVELADFLRELVTKLREEAPGHDLVCEADSKVISADQAIPIGLVVNELVTNAVKHAYPHGTGPVRVSLSVRDEGLRLSVRDEGVGLPPGFDVSMRQRSLGLKIIASLIRQLDGRLSTAEGKPGAQFVLDIPLG